MPCGCNETSNMAEKQANFPHSIVGRRLRVLREQLGWSQEKVGVAIGIHESSSRARISRYELGIHEPPIATARLLAEVFEAPLSFFYCDDDNLAELLLTLHRLDVDSRQKLVIKLLVALTPQD